jgi:hypothetical protein
MKSALLLAIFIVVACAALQASAQSGYMIGSGIHDITGPAYGCTSLYHSPLRPSGIWAYLAMPFSWFLGYSYAQRREIGHGGIGEISTRPFHAYMEPLSHQGEHFS